MIEDLNWKSLEDRRKIAKLTMMYKLVNGLVLVNTEDRLIPPDRISRNNNTKAYQMPSCSAEIRKESYFPRTIRDWNALPDNCITIGSLETFKGPPSGSILNHSNMFLSSLYICRALQKFKLNVYTCIYIFFFACASKKVAE
jgi:hypothetical protein